MPPPACRQRNVSPADPGKPTWFQASWAFILRPAGPDSTRLIVRWRHQLTPAYPALAPLTQFALGAVDAVMHRKQLRGIKQRAQNAGRRSPIAKAVTIHER
jgi:hypothetical protein